MIYREYTYPIDFLVQVIEESITGSGNMTIIMYPNISAVDYSCEDD